MSQDDVTRTGYGGPLPDPERIGLPERIGDYRVLRRLGEGGMGIVYEAEQEHPRRRVALKVVRGGQIVDELRVKMFEREAETLARLKHPGIASIYEAGRTEDGQHFFAMELVHGETLNVAMSQRGKPRTPAEISERLRLFRTICDAVNYAHQRGVIHRDLKPSNIIVTSATEDSGSSASGLPAIKILDFGLARIVDTDAPDPTVLTEVGMIKGTLPYMSPEQARGQGDAVDVRTDVYALGVILYEMISGARPYDVAASALLEAVRVICEEAPRPLAKSLGGTVRLDPDLQTILGKALEKDPERRYASAAYFSEDVERFLTSQPILARPPSAAYQLKKFAMRNRGLVTASVVVAAALVVGLVGTTLGFRRAQVEARRSERVAELMTQMLSGIRPEEAQGRDTTLLREILEDAANTVERTLAGEPEVAAAMRQTIGVSYSAIGDSAAAEPHLLASLDLHLDSYGADDPRTLSARSNLAVHRSRQGRFAEAERLHGEVYEDRRRTLGEDHEDTRNSERDLAILYLSMSRSQEAIPLLERGLAYLEGRGEQATNGYLVTLNSLGVAHLNLRHHAEAEELLVRSLERHRELLGADHPNTIRAVHNLAGLYADLDRFDEAAALHRDARDKLRQVLGEDHPVTLQAARNYASTLVRMNRPDEAEPLIQEVLERQREIFGAEHTTTLSTLHHLARVREAQRRPAEADALYQEVLETRRRTQGDDHRDTLGAIRGLAQFYMTYRVYDRARPLLEELIERSRRVLGDDDPETLTALHDYAIVLMRTQDYAGSEAAFREALEGRRRVLGNDHGDTHITLNSFGVLYMQQDRWDEAKALLTEALAGQRARYGDRHGDTLITFFNLGWINAYSDDHEEALRMFEAARAGFTDLYGEQHNNVLIAGRAMAMMNNKLERWDEAEREARESIDLARALGNELELSRAWRTLGSAQLGAGDPVAAETSYREGLALAEKVHPEGHQERAAMWGKVGEALMAQGRLDEAEPILLDAADRLAADSKAPESTVRPALEAVAELYEKTGQASEAAAWIKKYPIIVKNDE